MHAFIDSGLFALCVYLLTIIGAGLMARTDLRAARLGRPSVWFSARVKR